MKWSSVCKALLKPARSRIISGIISGTLSYQFEAREFGEHAHRKVHLEGFSLKIRHALPLKELKVELQDNLILSTGLVPWISHCEEIRKPFRRSKLRNCGLCVVYIQEDGVALLVGACY